MFRLLRIVTLLGVASQIAIAVVINVPEEYATIQLAVSYALDGDTVLLAEGEYSEAVSLPAIPLTICGPYLFSRDTSDIVACIWRGVHGGNDTLRCLTSTANVTNPPLHIVGIRFASSSARSSEEGGAVRLSHRSAAIEWCVFDSCKAGFGGALAILDSRVSIMNCRFNFCGANRIAAVIRIIASDVKLDSCLIENSYAFHEVDEIPEQITTSASRFFIANSEVRNCGLNFNPNGTYFIYSTSPPDTLQIVNTEFHDNHFNNLVDHPGNYLDLLRIDTCYFHDNILTGALYSRDGPDSAMLLQVSGNVFESFSPAPMRVMHGVFALDASRATIKIERNLVQLCSGGHTSFGSLFYVNTGARSVFHNYILQNSNFSVSWPPSGQILLSQNGAGDLQFNIFADNAGFAAFQGNSGGSTYAQHNYWNHSSGPYDSVGNPGGQGDTVEWRINYLPFEPDTSFMNAVVAPRPSAEIPNSFIGNAYPNPFNSTVTIEFVLLHDQVVNLDLFDLTGRHVETLQNGRMNKGVHTRTWQPKLQSSGIYFARLAGDQEAHSTVKLLFLK